MTPIPFKGGKGIATPIHIPFIAQHIAKLKNIDLVTVLKQVRENTRNMYGI